MPQSREPTREVDFSPEPGETVIGLQGDIRALYEEDDLPFVEPERTLAAPEGLDVVEAKLAKLPSLDPEKHYEVYRQIATIYQNEAGHVLDAIEFYERALSVRPGDFSVLQLMLELLTNHGYPQLCVNVIHRMLVEERNPARRCHFHYTAAVLLRDELHQPDAALEHFEMALDDNPRMLKAFHAIERRLRRHERWTDLEAAYRRMLDRLPDDADASVFVTILDKVARVNIEHLGDREAAREALSLAVQLDPHNHERRDLLERF